MTLLRSVGISFLVIIGMGCSSKDDGSNPGPVVVTLLDSSDAPLPGVDVVFHTSDGTVAELIATDSNGQVTSQVKSGAMATIVLDDVSASLLTIGVSPNNDVTIQIPATTVPDALGSVNVEIQATVGAAAEYYISVGCDEVLVTNLGLIPLLSLDESCATPGNTFYVVATAYDASGALIAFNHMVENTLPAGTVTLGAWRTDFQAVPVSFTNLPDEALAAGLNEPSVAMDGIEFALHEEIFGLNNSGTISFTLNVPADMQGLTSGFALLYGTSLGSFS